MLRSSPVLTATSAAFLLAPVAKAFGSGDSKMPTSGMPMPAVCACGCTVSTSQRSVSLAGSVMTCTPMERLAIHLEMSSEMNAPPKPNTAEKISRPVSSALAGVEMRSRPNTWMTRDSTSDDGDVGGDEQDNAFHVLGLQLLSE